MDVEEIIVNFGAEHNGYLLEQVSQAGVLYLPVMLLADLVTEIPKVKHECVMFTLEHSIEIVL